MKPLFDNLHLTEQKLCGQYYHTLLTHAPQQYRIVNGLSSDMEREERLFNWLKTITNLTSNHHTDHIIYNPLIRIQVISEEAERTAKHQENRIIKANICLR